MGMGLDAPLGSFGAFQMMILVCGLSKCGKTSLIQAAKSAGLSLPSVKASQLLRSSGRPITALTASQAMENQPELGKLLTAFIEDGMPVILDGHLLIETVDGPQLVPESSLLPIGLIGVIVVTTAPEIIAGRRVGTPFTTDLDEISDLTSIEVAQAKRLARLTASPFFQIEHDDTRAFTKSISLCLKTADARPH
jgi:adenylate kinase